ncbi:MAG: TRAP transporter substrate-binding protein [Gracilibacteraceae bacterium]|jgi:tripartite ATP-independent transporter DctP family solute receptor|nr:TRAP transporter substrate-binding protein [Gracilibacteraceae bacterium]
MGKRNLFFALSLCLIALLAVGCGGGAPAANTPAAGQDAATEPVTIIFAMDNTTGGPWDLGAKRLMELVEEKAPGRVKFEYYPDGQLSNNDQRTTIEMVQTGSVHLACVLPSIYEQFDQRWQVFSLPYLFSDFETARAACDGEAGQYLMSLLEEKQLHGLALWEHGFRHLTTGSKEIHLPGDVAGMKIRVMDSPTFISMFNLLKAQPTVTSMGELFTALQQHAVDGQENPLSSIAGRKFNEVQDYLMLSSHCYAPVILLSNKTFWDGLPEDVRQVLNEAALESTEYQRQVSEDYETTLKEELTQTMTIIEFTPEEIAAWQEAVYPVYDEFRDTIGADICSLFGI